MTFCLDCDAPISQSLGDRCHICTTLRLTLERPPQKCVLCGRGGACGRVDAVRGLPGGDGAEAGSVARGEAMKERLKAARKWLHLAATGGSGDIATAEVCLIEALHAFAQAGFRSVAEEGRRRLESGESANIVARLMWESVGSSDRRR